MTKVKKKMIVNFNTKINAELNDITATLLLSFFVGWKQTTQFWKQEDIANKLGLERKTIARKLKELKESQYIDFSAVGRNTAKRTKIELLEKAKKFIKSPQPPTTSLQNDVAKPIEKSQQSERMKIIQERANKCVTTAELYRLKMDVREGRL